jgi:hypothetical protein
MSHDALEPAAAPPAYEPSDAHPRAIAAWLTVLALAVGGVVLLVGTLMRGLEARAGERDPAPPARADGRPLPAPALQARPADDLERQRSLDAERTSEYAWVDRSAGRVRLPIERAMELLLERGLPARDRGPQPADGPGGGPSDAEERR